MKKLFYIALALFAFCALASSCQKDPMTLANTEWRIYRCEDMFNGSVVNSYEDGGDVFAFYESGEIRLKIGFDWAYSAYVYDASDYSIVRYTDSQFVMDMFYYEFTDVTPDELEFVTTFKGKKIYKEYYAGDVYYYYFKGNVAVDLGYTEDSYGNEYFYDTCRYYCEREY